MQTTLPPLEESSIISAIPRPDEIKQQLAHTVRQADLLRRLLKVSQRTHGIGRVHVGESVSHG